MSSVILFEDAAFRNFLPLTYWRAVFRLRSGRMPLMQRALTRLACDDPGLWVRPELQAVTAARHNLPTNAPAQADSLLVNGRWTPEGLPEEAPTPSVGMIEDEIAFVRCDQALADRLTAEVMLDEDRLSEAIASVPRVDAKGWLFRYPWDLVNRNGDMLLIDWDEKDAANRGEVRDGAHLIKPDRLHLGEHSVVKPGAVLDATEGPIFIGDRVTIMPNAVIEGPAYIGDDTVISAGAWIRTNVSIGPGCRVGGEVGISIIHALANKQHHGFMGHSYVAEWVNIGAGTTTSNLKNTYGEVKVPICGWPVETGEKFVGAFIGDFAKIGINSSLSTGSVIGFGTNLAISTFNNQFVASFKFITDRKDERYDVERCLAVAKKAMARRNVEMSSEEEAHFRDLCRISLEYESV